MHFEVEETNKYGKVSKKLQSKITTADMSFILDFLSIKLLPKRENCYSGGSPNKLKNSTSKSNVR